MPRHSFSPHWKKMYLFLIDKRTNWKPKALLVLAIVYLLWPMDPVSDFIPFLGWLDDLGIGILAAWYVSRTAKKEIQD